MLQPKTAIGERDRKIRIDSPNITDGDANSDEVNSWSVVCESKAKVDRPRHGHESYQADRLTSGGTTVFNIRFRPGITEKMRVVYHGKWYRIFSIQEVGRRRELDIAADLLDTEIPELT